MKFTLQSLFLCLLLAGSLLSCSDASTDREVQDRKQVLTDYRDYVTQFEQDSLGEVELRAMQQAENDSLTWAEKKQNRRQHFQQLKQQVDAGMADYTPEQQQEIQGLEQRYNTAEANHQRQYEEVSRRYKLRRQLLGLDVSNDDLDEITAANIVPTYQHFVQTLAQEATQLDDRSWEMVQGWWNALNNRRQAVAASLSGQDTNAIEDAAKQYQQLAASHI